MIKQTLMTEQKELVKNWKNGFKARGCEEGIKYVYEDGISAETYCAFMRLDYHTLKRLGDITYSIEYNCVDDKYILCCETYINQCMDGRISTEFEETEDFLGLYGEYMGDKLNLLEMTAEDLKKYLEQNYDEYSELEELIQKDVDEEDIAKTWIDENYDSAFYRAIDDMGDSDKREKLKEMIDSL